MRVDAGSAISADAQGYLPGVGPGVGGTDSAGHGGGGGGYGGLGGLAGDAFNPGGAAYGDAFAPVDLGSGGGSTQTAAGSGGSAIALNVTGTLTLDGMITANGGNAANGNCFSAPGGGGGAGGSIFITTATLAGAGSATANGGTGGDGGCFPSVGDDGGGGAGGRIAVLYSIDGGFGGFTTSRVSGGVGGGHVGAPGTTVFRDTMTDGLRISQHLDIAPDSSVRFGAVTLDSGATLTLGGGTTLTIDNDFIVTGSSTVIAHGKNAAGQVEGAWQGAGVTIDARNVHVETGGTISADREGYLAGMGPGAGGSDGMHGGGGGGYGGIGGRAGDDFNAGGPAYGDAFAPGDLGSGGGPTRTAAGSGGGAITLHVTETLTLDGLITAKGGDGEPGNCFSARPAWERISTARRTAQQRIIHGNDDLTRGDRRVVVHIPRKAITDAARTERNVDHPDELIDGDPAIAVAIPPQLAEGDATERPVAPILFAAVGIDATWFSVRFPRITNVVRHRHGRPKMPRRVAPSRASADDK